LRVPTVESKKQAIPPTTVLQAAEPRCQPMNRPENCGPVKRIETPCSIIWHMAAVCLGEPGQKRPGERGLTGIDREIHSAASRNQKSILTG